MEIVNCPQGTPDWYQARCGLPTASEFATILAKGKSGAESKTRRSYLLRLAGELLTGEPADTFSNYHMERGKALEDEARALYTFMADAELQQVGFIRNAGKGCSPDALVGSDGALEIKTKLPALLLDLILRDEFPPDHKAQTQGVLWVGEREWIDLFCYWPNLPPFIKRAHRDEAYIAELATAVDQFNHELANVVETIRRYGQQEAA